jgi:hypothetical protein
MRSIYHFGMASITPIRNAKVTPVLRNDNLEFYIFYESERFMNR